MDLCPQDVVCPGLAADGATSAVCVDGAADARGASTGAAAGAGGVAVPEASRRVGPLARLRAYLASRIARWASALLIVGSPRRGYAPTPTPSARRPPAHAGGAGV